MSSMHEEAIEHLTKADRTLARLIRKVGPCGLKARKRCSPFQALVQSVAHQQLNGTAANTILKRVMALYSWRKFPTPDDVLATPDEKLRGAGCRGRRLRRSRTSQRRRSKASCLLRGPSRR